MDARIAEAKRQFNKKRYVGRGSYSQRAVNEARRTLQMQRKLKTKGPTWEEVFAGVLQEMGLAMRAHAEGRSVDAQRAAEQASNDQQHVQEPEVPATSEENIGLTSSDSNTADSKTNE